MAKPKTNDLLAALETLGFSAADIAQALIGSDQAEAVAPKRATFSVDIVTGDKAKQFGDISVAKFKGDYKDLKMGIFAADLAGFIEQLQAAQELLNAK